MKNKIGSQKKNPTKNPQQNTKKTQTNKQTKKQNRKNPKSLQHTFRIVFFFSFICYSAFIKVATSN